MSKQNHSRALAARLFAAGTLLASAGNGLADVRYVDLNSTSPTPPYTSWVTAATNIQDAVDAAVAGDDIVVTNGTYASGGRATVADSTINRVAVDKPLSLRSVNGPQFTVMDGGGSFRCVYLTNGGTLSGFTLTNGSALEGAGVWCESTNVLVFNCVMSGNSFAPVLPTPLIPCGGGAYGGTLSNCTLSNNRIAAFYPMVHPVFVGIGAGAYNATLNNCSLNGNMASSDGGGASRCTLNNCTLTGNSAPSGGGAIDSILNNCTLTDNGAGGSYGVGRGGGGAYGCTLNNCTVSGNSAHIGGGAAASTLNNCILIGNEVVYEWVQGSAPLIPLHPGSGGAAYLCTLNNCTLSANLAVGSIGGGAAFSTLNNCSLTGNRADSVIRYVLDGEEVIGGDGGGVSSCMVNFCTLVANSTSNFFGVFSLGGGGGAFQSTLNNSILTGNESLFFGGGSYVCTLNNCTLVGNGAGARGGGTYGGILNNCIVYFNSGGNYDDQSTLNYCCTTLQPTYGVGNITNAPLFVDQAGGNLRLQANSPCINAGLNALAPAGPDRDGNPRIKGGSVDIGAYEYQSPTSMISYAWLQQYGLPNDGSADTADPDGDGLNNWQEWRCGTDPTNALSALRLLAPAPVGSGLVVRWESVPDRTYFLERSTTASSGFTPLATDILGQAGTTTYTDTNPIGARPWFYRVGVGAQ